MKKCSLLFMTLLAVSGLSAQRLAVKTNLLYDVTGTFNAGLEFRTAPRWTLDLSANYNPLQYGNNRKMKHWLFQPEVRYWPCEAYNGHFLALHALGGEFNVGNMDLYVYPSFKGYRYQGYLYGAGLGYGYQFVLGSRWNLGLQIGLGWLRANYDRYDCVTCGTWLGRGKKDLLGVTKASVSLVYLIK